MHKAAALNGKEMISAGQGNEKRCAVKRQCFRIAAAVLTVSDIAAVYDAAVAAGRRRFRDGVGVGLECRVDLGVVGVEVVHHHAVGLCPLVELVVGGFCHASSCVLRPAIRARFVFKPPCRGRPMVYDSVFV